MAEILDTDVLLVVLVPHGLRHLDHLGEIKHSYVRFTAFLLNRDEVHLLIKVLMQDQTFFSGF